MPHRALPQRLDPEERQPQVLGGAVVKAVTDAHKQLLVGLRLLGRRFLYPLREAGIGLRELPQMPVLTGERVAGALHEANQQEVHPGCADPYDDPACSLG